MQSPEWQDWETVAKAGLGENLSQAQRDVILGHILIRILLALFATRRRNRWKKRHEHFRTTIVNSTTIPRLPGFQNFQDAAQTFSAGRSKGEVEFRSLEEHQRKLGPERFRLETNDMFFL
jgi:hypothetical protein